MLAFFSMFKFLANPRVLACIAIAVALAASHWKLYVAGRTGAELRLTAEFQLERDDWRGKVSAAEIVARKQQDDARLRANAANMQHSKQLAAVVKLSRENSNEITKYSKDLSSCKLDDGLVRLLNNEANAADAGAGAD
jgi:hypothetical protein